MSALLKPVLASTALSLLSGLPMPAGAQLLASGLGGGGVGAGSTVTNMAVPNLSLPSALSLVTAPPTVPSLTPAQTIPAFSPTGSVLSGSSILAPLPAAPSLTSANAGTSGGGVNGTATAIGSPGGMAVSPISPPPVPVSLLLPPSTSAAMGGAISNSGTSVPATGITAPPATAFTTAPPPAVALTTAGPAAAASPPTMSPQPALPAVGGSITAEPGGFFDLTGGTGGNTVQILTNNFGSVSVANGGGIGKGGHGITAGSAPTSGVVQTVTAVTVSQPAAASSIPLALPVNPVPGTASSVAVDRTANSAPSGNGSNLLLFTYGPLQEAGPDTANSISLPGPNPSPPNSGAFGQGDTVTVKVKAGSVSHAQDYDLRSAVRLAARPLPVDSNNLPVTGPGATATSVGLENRFVVMPGIRQPGETLEIYRPADSGQVLDFASFGMWNTFPFRPGRTTQFGVVAGGRDSPANAVPKTGAANYSGATVGALLRGAGQSPQLLHGEAALSVDFGTGTVGGTFNIPNTFSFRGMANIASGTNRYGGTTQTTAVASQLDPTLPASMTGSLRGAFYGPLARETAGTWSLHGGNVQAMGSFGAKK